GVPVDGHRLRRRAKRRLVGGQLEHFAAGLRHRALAGGIGRNIEDAGVRHGAGHLLLAPDGDGVYRDLAAPFGATVYRVAWLPTRAVERTDAPASIRAVLIFSKPVPVIDTRSAAPSKAMSGTATISASGASARAISAFHPDTRTLQVSTSVTIALSATRDTTKTGSAAGWSARSRNGHLAMI